MKESRLWILLAAQIALSGLVEGTPGLQGRYAGFELDSYLQLRRATMEKLTGGGGQQVDLVNLSQKGITAFCLELRTSFEDGTSSLARRFEDFAVTEWYRQDRSLPHRAGVLHPGQLKRMTVRPWAKDGLLHTFFSVEVVAVVFADRSAVGDREALEKIFRGREEEQLVRRHWIQRLDETLSMSLADLQLRNRLKEFQALLQDRSEIYGNYRVSSSSLSASTQTKVILGDLKDALSLKSSSELVRRLEALRANWQQDFEVMSRHVKHDVEGMPKQLK